MPDSSSPGVDLPQPATSRVACSSFAEIEAQLIALSAQARQIQDHILDLARELVTVSNRPTGDTVTAPLDLEPFALVAAHVANGSVRLAPIDPKLRHQSPEYLR